MLLDWTRLSPQQKLDAIMGVWQDGFSATDIAACFDNCTKNAIVSMYRRAPGLKLTHPLSGAPGPKTEAGKALAKATEERARKNRSARMRDMTPSRSQPRTPSVVIARQAAKRGAVKPWKDKVIPADANPSLLVDTEGCRFPVSGDEAGNTYFCNASIGYNSYCEHHAKRSYLKRRDGGATV